MSKRRFNPGSEEDRIPIVEKLYRENQPSFYGEGGFFDDDDEDQERRDQIIESRQKRHDAAHASSEVPDNCSLCQKALLDSWLWERYNHPVCDTCRDDKGAHQLIPRTEVKKEFLLKDCDLDQRKPILRFYSKKNPHNPRYGDMKLYLRLQVIERMLDVFGSWENFEKEKELREQVKETKAEKNFEKKVKEMRQQIRGISGAKVKFIESHEHTYGPESYNEEDDIYSKECVDCGFILTFEKM
ncbi:unnamed protein product [Auanema sp. JU1783]|nr:unnamed protein product [Auanema sp. JU1783]